MAVNIRALVRPIITAINPDQPVIVLACVGQQIDGLYDPRPEYAPAVQVMAQAQPVPDRTLQFLVQQRDNSIWFDFYLMGNWDGLSRDEETGGDLLYWDGFEWLADQVLERWSPTVGWTKIRFVRQRATPPPAPGDTLPPVTTEGAS